MQEVDTPVATDGEKLHIYGLLVGFITGLPNLIFPALAALFAARSSGYGQVILILMLGLLLGGSLFFRWLAWTRFRYHIGAEDIRIESGIINRSARSIPYERIQDVSIEQKPVARLFGLAKLMFETGGGKGEDGTLAYVTMPEAERLRDLVRARKAGVADAPAKTEDAGQAAAMAEPETPPIFAMDTARVLTLGFYSFSLVVFAVLFGVAQQFDFLLRFDVWDIGAWLGIAEERGATLNGLGTAARIVAGFAALSGLIIVGFATGIIRTFLREYGFRLDHNDKGFRRRRGLLTLTDVAMPVHRIQAATISTGPIRKLRGWRALKFVSLAGDSGAKDKGESDHVVAPLATLQEIEHIAKAASIALPDADVSFIRSKWVYWLDHWLMFVPFVLAGVAALALFADAGSRAALPLIILVAAAAGLFLQWRRSLYALDGDYLFIRRGWWKERMTVAPQVKVQSVEIAQGPVERLRGLAEIRFGIAGGSLSIVGLPLANAQAIRGQVMAQVAAVDYSEISAMQPT